MQHLKDTSKDSQPQLSSRMSQLQETRPTKLVTKWSLSSPKMTWSLRTSTQTASHCLSPTLSVYVTTLTQLTSWWTIQASVFRWLISRPSVQLSSMLSITQISSTIILGKEAKKEIIKWSVLGRYTSMTRQLVTILSRQAILPWLRLWQQGAIAHVAIIFGRSSIQLTLSWSSLKMLLSSHTIRLKRS